MGSDTFLPAPDRRLSSCRGSAGSLRLIGCALGLLVFAFAGSGGEKHVSVCRNVPTKQLKSSPIAWTRVGDACR